MQGTGGDIFEEGNGKSITLRLVRVLVWNISSSISSLLQYPLTPPSACTFDLGTERCACPPTERDKLNVPLVNEMQLIFPNELLDCDTANLREPARTPRRPLRSSRNVFWTTRTASARGSPMPWRNLMRCLELLPRNSFNRERKALR